MNILITGSSGLIGTHIAESFSKNTEVEKIFCVDVAPPKTIENSKIEFNSIDILSENAKLNYLLGKSDVIFHLAGAGDVNKIAQKPGLAKLYNYELTESLMMSIRYSRTSRLKKFVLASSTWVYKCCRDTLFNEESLLNPELAGDEYTYSKVVQELMCIETLEKLEIPYLILRYSLPYGYHTLRGFVISNFLRNAYNKRDLLVHFPGCQIRNFIHLDDILELNNILLRSKALNRRIYNVCSQENVTILELAKLVVKKFTPNSKIIEIANREIDYVGHPVFPKLIEKDLGWQAQTGLEEGLRKNYEVISRCFSHAMP
jgi:UDP-glucose 4-epimerase